MVWLAYRVRAARVAARVAADACHDAPVPHRARLILAVTLTLAVLTVACGPAGSASPLVGSPGPPTIPPAATATTTAWTVHAIPGKAVIRRWHIATNGSIFVVASGDDGVLQPVRPQFWISADRVAWNRIDIDQGIHGTVTALSATPTGFVAFVFDDGPRDAIILTSTDGRSWARQGPLPKAASARGGGVEGTIRTADGMLAVGATAGGGLAAWHSGDGKAWIPLNAPTPGGIGGPRAVVAVAAGYAAVGAGNGVEAAWTSADGAVWTPATIKPGAPPGSVMLAVAKGPKGSLLAVGGGADPTRVIAWASADGMAWRPLDGAPADSAWRTVVAGRDGWVVLGNRGPTGTAWRTVDGTDWTPLQVPVGVALFDDAVVVDGRLVAVGNDSTGYSSFVIVEGPL